MEIATAGTHAANQAVERELSNLRGFKIDNGCRLGEQQDARRAGNVAGAIRTCLQER